MKLPLKWLKDYVDIEGVSVEQLKDKLFSGGFEVEEIIESGKEISKVVVGKVLTCEGIPETHLHLCTVDVGSGEPLQICCGADNVKVGIKAPCALVGATVYETGKDHKTIEGVGTIKAGKLRGYDSFGMLCAGVEIGVTEEMYKGAGYDGLLILDDSCEIGADVKPIVGLGEVVFDISVTANRPDCQSILGLAREVAAILGRPFKMPNLSYTETDVDVNSKVSVTVDASDLCPRYMASYVYDVVIKESPSWLKERLLSVGLRPINNIVDITNFVLTEIGQPMHSFDYKNLEENRIVVRRAGDGEKITTLDDMEFTLNNNNLVICDGVKPQCIAGVMGGKDSCISDETKEIVFEAAMFKRDSIRKTSRSLGKRSDSSSRFEKGTDAYLANLGMQRALALICETQSGKIAKGIVDVNNSDMSQKTIKTTITKINKVLGIDVPKDTIKDILERLYFGVKLDGDNIDATIPAFRDDVEDYPDLSEEVIRIYGYDNIYNTLLKDADITVGGKTKEQKDIDILKNYMVSQGFNEAITYSFVSEKEFDAFGLDKQSEEYRFVKLLNPIGEDFSVMRTTLLPSMVRIIANNLNKKNMSGRLFELAKTYIPKSLPLEEIPVQEDSLVIGMFGDGEDFFTIKGVVEGMFKTLKASFNIDFVPCTRSFMHPTRSAEVVFGNNSIGYIGELNPIIAAKLGIDKRIYVGEIKYEKIAGMLNRKLKYKQISKFPSIERDLALVMNKSVTNGQVIKVIKKGSDKSLVNVELFDIYEGDRIQEGKKSLAYHLTFTLTDRSLTMEEVDGFVGKILANLKKEGIELR